MVANPRRRQELLDAGLQVLGAEGGRALTHRAVDARAGLPNGTCANYFPSRSELMCAMAQRSFERLAPAQAELDQLQRLEGPGAVAAYVQYATQRLLDQPSLALALVELRLEAARNSEVRNLLLPFLREGFAQDVDFHTSRGLDGGADLVEALHHLTNGIVLDRLTAPLRPQADPVDTAGWVADRLADTPR
ncbi:TetR family transcriptional regulator [Kocuria soli]|uniref:TetR family transcriptional regulator n=1 Tax=Kocuria soli TaxID=2485125 RepID=A0A3N3ZLU1_9MICC|nr:TetR/AcrR family transcriptional regulator [Kocuria soli]ROZ61515.1 TetR family transcriptional regulator [Kocuria soli]